MLPQEWTWEKESLRWKSTRNWAWLILSSCIFNCRRHEHLNNCCRLASLIADKYNKPYSRTIHWLLAKMQTQFLSAEISHNVSARIQIFNPPPYQLTVWSNWPGSCWRSGFMLIWYWTTKLMLKLYTAFTCYFYTFLPLPSFVLRFIPAIFKLVSCD